MTTIIGIDPGQSGGIAINDRGDVRAIKMPETLADFVAVIVDIGHIDLAAVELVGPMPKQGVTSTFKFGRGFGQLEGVLSALLIPVEYVRPQKWQKAMGCLTKGDKNVSKAKAQQLWPEIRVTHTIADALLICEWGRRHFVSINGGG